MITDTTTTMHGAKTTHQDGANRRNVRVDAASRAKRTRFSTGFSTVSVKISDGRRGRDLIVRQSRNQESGLRNRQPMQGDALLNPDSRIPISDYENDSKRKP